MAENATISQMGEKTDALEAGGEPPVAAVDVPAKPQAQVGKSYVALQTLTDQFILVESRRGTGKTRAILSEFVRRCRSTTRAGG